MHDLGVVAACDSLASAVALEALVDVADDLQLVVHGEMQLSEDFLLPPNLSGPMPCIKLVLLTSLEHLYAVEVEVDPVQPILLVHLLDSLVDPLNGLQPVHKVWPWHPLLQVRGIRGDLEGAELWREEEGGE